MGLAVPDRRGLSRRLATAGFPRGTWTEKLVAPVGKILFGAVGKRDVPSGEISTDGPPAPAALSVQDTGGAE